MKDGFIRVAAASPRVTPANCEENVLQIAQLMQKARQEQVALLALPEHCLTGYALGDLFLQHTLLEAAERGLAALIEQSAESDTVVVAGLPVRRGASLYSCAAVFQRGRLLGVVPKLHIPNYAEFYEARHFCSGEGAKGLIRLAGFEAPFGADLIFTCEQLPEFNIGVEICEDLWVPCPPSGPLARAGATVIVNPSASTFVAGKQAYRRSLVEAQSARCMAGYVYASCGEGESSTDLVFAGHLMIAENGRMLKEAREGGMETADLDTQLLTAERRRMSTFTADEGQAYRTVPFSIERVEYTTLRRPVERRPFVPATDALYRERCAEVLDIQSAGLAKRLAHTHAKTAVVAVSGGLDSTLALLVTARAIRRYNLLCSIIAITMPGPGTTPRTKGNAETLCHALQADLRTIPIGPALEQHLRDIGHGDAHDVTYENAQARERMQIAMDVANMEGGLVVGTGDMSELALGFTTYNGDHMSMYGVNCGVPKTLVRHLIKYVADEPGAQAMRDTLYDILDTPVSPELLPAKDGAITQKTEQILGPYELHDFYLYYFLRYGFEPLKILRLARAAFGGEYEDAFLRGCLITFVKRFFAAQFKRSCVPDGPKVGSVALSPRGDWRMPSDALCTEWLRGLAE